MDLYNHARPKFKSNSVWGFINRKERILKCFCHTGVPASRTMAGEDLAAMAQWKSWIEQAGAAMSIQPAVIAGKWLKLMFPGLFVR